MVKDVTRFLDLFLRIPVLGVEAPGQTPQLYLRPGGRINFNYILTDSTVSESPLRVPSTVTSCPAWGIRVSGLVIL